MFVLKRNSRTYNVGISNVSDFEYVNVYASDITQYITQVEEKEQQISELKDFYEFILNNIPSDIAVFDSSHRYLFLNPKAISNPELRKFMIGKDDYDYCEFKGVSIDIADKRRSLFNGILIEKRPIEWVDDLIDRNGNNVSVLRRMSPIVDEKGEISYVIGYGVDITDRINAENNLLEATNRLKLLEKFLDRTTDAIQVGDENGNMIYVNDAAANRLGIEKEKIQEYRVQDFELYFNEPGVWENHIEEMRHKGVFVIESENLNTKTGEVYQVEVSVTYEEISGMGYLIAASRDIRERKKAEEEIRKLSLVAKNTNNGVIMMDVNRKITWVNEAMVKRSEYSIEELIGQSPKLFQYEGTNPETVAYVYRQLLELKPVTAEILHQSKSGGLYWINLNIQPIFDEKGLHIGFMAVEFDITERKDFEEQIEVQNKSLKEISDALDQSSLVSIANTKGFIIRANKKFCEVSKYEEEELIGKYHNIVNSGYHPKEFWSEMWRTINSGKIWRGEIKNKAKDGTFYWVDSIIYPITDLSGNILHFLSIRHEITERKQAEDKLIIKSSFQNLLMEIASKYINLPIDQLNFSISESLEKLGSFVGVDRVYIFDYNYEKQTSSNLFEWCEEGVEQQIDNLQDIPFSDMPIWLSKHTAGEEVYVPDVSKLKPGKFKELLEVQDIKSIITLPLIENDKCIGFVGFDAVRQVKEFNEDEKNLLKLYSEMLVNVSSRTDYIREIEQSRKEIFQINENLEKIVQEKTQKNLELAKSISDQEKLVMIGEIASGIAHDLNTPLGAIKSGAESIRYTLESLFKNTIWMCSPEQIKYACGRAVESDFELFIGGMQIRRETNEFLNYLNENYSGLSESKAKELSSLFVKARIGVDEKEVIANIVSAENKELFLDLIYHIQMTRTFVDTILSSGERAANVVQDLRSFIKDQKKSGKTLVNLKTNITTVINIFNYELKRVMEVTFDVNPDLFVEGYDVRLFQLWSNLIKNAIDSIDEMDNRGTLKIVSFETKDEIAVSVENNGPPIPEKIKSKIFDKFFTTKAERQGSGLGLSIVKNVIEEHNARIEVESDTHKTTFTVFFKKSENITINSN